MHKHLFLKRNSCYANIQVSSWNTLVPTITNFVHLLQNKLGIFSSYKRSQIATISFYMYWAQHWLKVRNSNYYQYWKVYDIWITEEHKFQHNLLALV
jgi:hypothetical protein